MTDTDAELVARALAGDTLAYGQLVDKYRPAVYGLAYHRMGDRDEAEDIAQEAFVRAYVSLRQLRDTRRFAAWLAAIAHNACSKRARARRRPRDDRAPPPEEGRRTGAVRAAVQEALAGLPDGQRLALILHCVDGYSHAEIAGFLDVPRSTVAGRIHRAKTKLRRRMMELLTTTIQSDTPGQPMTEKVLAEIRTFAEMDFGPEEGPMHLTPHGQRTSLVFPRSRRAGFEVQYTEFEPGHHWAPGRGRSTLEQQHLAHDVVYVVLRGELRLCVGDEEKSVRSNESVYLPWGTPHAFLPVGSDGLTLMTIGVCKPDEALPRYEAAVEKRPRNARAWRDLALACEAAASSSRPDELRQAIQAWTRWTELSESDADAAAEVERRRRWVAALERIGVAMFD
jgi:RNA polymerase sigma-70 factor (ECF subfamily)